MREAGGPNGRGQTLALGGAGPESGGEPGEGEELVVVQRTLGHARQSITADLYVGRVPKALRKAADRYGELLDPASEAAG